MALGRPVWRATRLAIQELLTKGNEKLRDNSELLKVALIPLTEVKMHLPAKIGYVKVFFF